VPDFTDRKGGDRNATPMVPQFSVDTPFGAANKCGEVVYLDFHVTNWQFANAPFPTECSPVSNDRSGRTGRVYIAEHGMLRATCSDPKAALQLLELVRILRSKVLGLAEIVVAIVQLPFVGTEFGKANETSHGMLCRVTAVQPS
jgi:hypothetical protein